MEYLLIRYWTCSYKQTIKTLDSKQHFISGGQNSILKTLVTYLVSGFLNLHFPYIVLRLIPNIYIYMMGLRRLPEFAGYKARMYPGQLLPQSVTISPRRLTQQDSAFTQDRTSKQTFIDVKKMSMKQNTLPVVIC